MVLTLRKVCKMLAAILRYLHVSINSHDCNDNLLSVLEQALHLYSDSMYMLVHRGILPKMDDRNSESRQVTMTNLQVQCSFQH